MLADTPAKHMDPQAAMKTHLSQSTGTGAFDGQHGISSAISSIVADDDISDAGISCAMACVESCGDAAAMTGRETGANARPAIIKTASSRRMATLRFTRLNSHRFVAAKSLLSRNSSRLALIGIKRTFGAA